MHPGRQHLRVGAGVEIPLPAGDVSLVIGLGLIHPNRLDAVLPTAQHKQVNAVRSRVARASTTLNGDGYVGLGCSSMGDARTGRLRVAH